MTENIVIQGELISIQTQGNKFKLEIEVKTLRPEEYFGRDLGCGYLHLGIISVGQGITAYGELKKTVEM